MVFYRTENTAVFFDIDADGTDIPCGFLKALERERTFCGLFPYFVADMERHGVLFMQLFLWNMLKIFPFCIFYHKPERMSNSKGKQEGDHLTFS